MNSELVKCPYCSKEMKQITKNHLKFKHFKTMEEMIIEFPGIKTTSDIVKDKMKETFIKKYGVDNPSKTQEVKDKIKETFIEKYGVSCSLHNSEIQEKVKATNRERYGTDYYFASDNAKDKIEKTNNERYGCHPRKLDKIKDKAKTTCIEKYGVDNPFKNEEIKTKIKSTNQEKYGVDNPSQNKEIQDKRSNTMISKFGIHYYPNGILSAKIKYNVINVSQLDFIKQKKRNRIMSIQIPKVIDFTKELSIQLIDKEYIDAFYNHNWLCLECGTEFSVNWCRLRNGYKCPICFPSTNGTSEAEIEIKDFVKSLGFDIIENDRDIIKPKELDIVIPEKSIAIEYCGLYWHNNERKDEKYHLNKLEKCLDKGYRLITIFEDEWIFKKDLVKRRLSYILNKTKSKKLHARKCKIEEISPSQKNDFLNMFHIQGSDSATVKLGAFHENKLVSVMTFSHGNISKGSKSIEGVWELNRFCTDYNYHIPGIASKILSYFEKNYDWKLIFSYADRRWNTGNIYEKIGFKFDKFTKPNYWYIKGFDRIHRFNLRKKEDEPKSMTESELRLIEGYTRIYDCGSSKYVLKKEMQI